MKDRVPNPDWKPGDPIVRPNFKTVPVDFDRLGTTDAYKFLIGSIVPRPIAFISTKSREGIVNLAPFSFFNGVSSKPPCLMISFTRKTDTAGAVVKKDTLRNIETTGEFVVNTVSEWMAEPMNHCSADYPFGVDEMARVGFTPVPSEKVQPPRVGESPVQMECRLEKMIEIGDGEVGSSTLVIGRLVMAHVMEAAWDRGKIRWDVIQPLARMGGLNYGCTREVFELPRPKL